MEYCIPVTTLQYTALSPSAVNDGHYCCAYTSVRVVMLCPCGSGWNAVWYSLQNLFHVKKVLLVVHERQFCVKDIGENGCKLHHSYICSSEIVQLWASS